MGQGQSEERREVSIEQLSHHVAERFATKCYTALEPHCYKHVFRSLADTESGVRYWDESTLCRFLELPDALGAGPVLFQMATYLGAFPFGSQAPSILTVEALLKVVTLMTGRYGKILRRGQREWIRVLYRSLAVHDRRASQSLEVVVPTSTEEERRHERMKDILGGVDTLVIDTPVEDQEDEDQDEDELALAALELVDAPEAFKARERTDVHKSIIPSDNFLKLLELLLLAAPLNADESLLSYAAPLSDERLIALRRTANNILWSFSVERHPGVTYTKYTTVIPASLPFLFDGLNPLFERFLFAKDFDLSKRKTSTSSGSFEVPPEPNPAPPAAAQGPLLPREGDILDLFVLSQLSFFIKGTNLFRRLRPLYSGGEAGFSMGSFEKCVFNWRAPSILLVSGTRLPSVPFTSRERAFHDALPPKRFPDSAKGADSSSNRLVFGAFASQPWKQTYKECFGDPETLLFQLEPVHEVFRASKVSDEYISFNRPPTDPAGIGFGCPTPATTKASHHSSLGHHITLGPVSLFLDDALEFGVFTHNASGGGSFHPSNTRKSDWQDRFEIEALEVWGCGGDEEAERQRKAWAWEEREAEMRKQLNVGKGDVEADRELLRMAGLIGQGQSGGSMA